MMVHLHRAEERMCDGCERRSVIFDVRGGRSERGLSLCQQCFRDFTGTLVEAASRIRGNLEAAPLGGGT
jgi:hypothetical protein